MKTTSKTVLAPVGSASDEQMRLENQIMERALMLWHKKGPGQRNAVKALLQAKREILVQNRKASKE